MLLFFVATGLPGTAANRMDGLVPIRTEWLADLSPCLRSRRYSHLTLHLEFFCFDIVAFFQSRLYSGLCHNSCLHFYMLAMCSPMISPTSAASKTPLDHARQTINFARLPVMI